MQTQKTTAKKPHTKKSKHKDANLAKVKTPAPPYFDELAKCNCKDKRCKWLKKKKDSTPATGNNVIEGKKKQIFGNTSQVTCYNY